MKSPRQGEILLLLSNRSGKSKSEIAENLNINPSHLSKLFKSEILTSKIKAAASEYFGVDISIFEGSNLGQLPNPQLASEPGFEYFRQLDDMTAGEVLKYMEEKDE